MDRKIRGLTFRELTGAALLTLLLAAGLLVSWIVGRQQEEMAGVLDNSSWLALSDQWENARRSAGEAKLDWEKHWRLLAAVADHGPMEEIDRLFEELTVYESAGNRMEFARVCALLSRQMEALGSSQSLSWWNLF